MLKIQAMSKFFLGILFVFFISMNCFSQNTNYGFEVKEHYGFTIAHRQSMLHYLDRHYSIIDVSFYQNTSQENCWQQYYNFPKMGVAATYSNFGGSNKLGQAIGVFGFLTFENPNKNICFSFKLGAGAGYLSKPFDREKNYKNIAVGSHINGLIRLEPSVKFNLSEKFSLTTGIGFTHFSNAATKTPNLGINIATVQMGARYYFGARKIKPRSENMDSIFNSKRYAVYIHSGLKQVYPANGPFYGFFIANFNYLIHHYKKGTWGLGADFFYSPSLHEELMSDLNPNNNNNPVRQFALNVNHEFNFGRLSLPLILGVYVIDKVKKNGLTSQSVGIRYKLNQHLIASVILKSHFAKAEYVQWGLGWTW